MDILVLFSTPQSIYVSLESKVETMKDLDILSEAPGHIVMGITILNMKPFGVVKWKFEQIVPVYWPKIATMPLYSEKNFW